jgi:molecular chaperone DnaK (HSP70)
MSEGDEKIIADHLSNEFVLKYRMDPRTNKKAYLRLSAEVEKLKKQMSATRAHKVHEYFSLLLRFVLETLRDAFLEILGRYRALGGV